MGEYQSSRVVQEGRLYNLSGVDTRTVDSTSEKLFPLKNAVSVVEVYRSEDLVLKRRQGGSEVLFGEFWTGQVAGAFELV